MGFRGDIYLRRIGLEAPPALSPEGLAELHLAQGMSIPFETIDPYLGQGVSLDLGELQQKLVHQDRGGYCFELNGLFLEALRVFGFRARPLLARVLIGNAKPGPLTHQLSLVELGSEAWIADVGFGGPGLREPMRLKEGEVSQGGRILRLRREEALGWVLEQAAESGWQSIYAFELREVREIDRVMGNHFTATWPGSLFRKRLMAARLLPEGRVTLDDRLFRHYSEGELREEYTLDNWMELGHTLAGSFGIALPRLTLQELDAKLGEQADNRGRAGAKRPAPSSSLPL